jgi:hypothetical protein
VADEMVVTIVVREPDADDDRLDGLADDLRDLAGAARVGRPAGGPAPAGSRGDLETIGAVLVTAQTSVELLRVIIATVSDWMARGRAAERTSSIRLRIGDKEIEVDGATEDQQQKLIDAFLSADGGADRS